MNIRNLIIVVTLSFVATGCSSIPQAAIDVNKQVSSGISVLGENGIEMVNEWEQTAYNMLDERWSKIYEKAEESYRSKRGIVACLTTQQQKEVAELLTLIRDEARSKIRAEANNMRSIITSNIQNTLAANKSITNLLVSANAVATFQQSAIKEVGNLIPIPPTISTFINKQQDN